MVAELVETTRLWGRVAARIDPTDVEPLAGHLVRRTYSEPRWDPRRGSVVATERVTLYGLPIVTDRTVQYGRIDPVLSRELFIRRALVEGEWETRHAFVEENRRLVEEVEALEHRARRRDLLADDQARFEFFDARVPDDVVSAAGFDRWWREQRLEHPDLLTYTRSVLVRSPDAVDEQAWPATWRQGDLTLDLDYRFEPGAEDDGVTVVVPLQLLGQVRADRFEWLVPGLREELVTTLLRGLPKELRRQLVPMPETAARVLGRLEPRRRPLAEDMSRALPSAPVETWDFSRLPPHLRMTFRVVDAKRGVLAAGKSLSEVRARVRPLLRDELTRASSTLERSGHDVVGDRLAAARGDAARDRPGGARVPGAGRRGLDGRRQGAGDARPRSGRHVGGHSPAAAARDPLPRAVRAGPARQRRAGWRCRRRRTAAWRRCSTTRPSPPPTR